MKKAKNYPLKKPLQTKFYTDEKQYEYIARLAFGRPGRLQSVFEERMFISGWEEMLEHMRKAHRDLNIPDERFLHETTIRRLNLDPRLARSIEQD